MYSSPHVVYYETEDNCKTVFQNICLQELGLLHLYASLCLQAIF